MAIQLFELPNRTNNVRLRLAKGHFATSHSHINYYVDLTMTKHRLNEAREAAAVLCNSYSSSTIVDTILCLDGTEVVGACMASELTRAGFTNMNAHRTIYVVTPEHTSGSQLIFRDNTAPMIVGKHVLILAASVTTGYTVQAAVEAVRYYGGMPVGISCIFSCVQECAGFPVVSIFNKQRDLPDYESHPSVDCPMCKNGEKLDGLVNSFGVSTF
ncbi:MAG: orotate phosphoribosyltransferase [Clostridiales bacterium]|nr:orotate phosphoribosyltransferase [Clostridiales bacterium]